MRHMHGLGSSPHDAALLVTLLRGAAFFGGTLVRRVGKACKVVLIVVLCGSCAIPLGRLWRQCMMLGCWFLGRDVVSTDGSPALHARGGFSRWWGEERVVWDMRFCLCMVRCCRANQIGLWESVLRPTGDWNFDVWPSDGIISTWCW